MPVPKKSRGPLQPELLREKWPDVNMSIPMCYAAYKKCNSRLKTGAIAHAHTIATLNANHERRRGQLDNKNDM